MSKIVLAICLASLSLFALEFKSYDSALIEQQKTNKLIMIDVVRTGCHYCEYMDEEVFGNKEMGQWITEKFIPVQINLDEEELPLGLKVSFTPTFYFVDKDKKIVKKIPGAWNIEDFKSLTEKIK